MIIKPDFEGRNDGYDDDTIRYYESIDDDGYFYECYVLVNDKKSRIVITDEGVSIDFKESGETLCTDIVPKDLFPDHTSLNWNQICKILIILKNERCISEMKSKKFMDDNYEEWKYLTKYQEN